MSKNVIQEQSDRLMEKWQAIDRAYEEYAKFSGMTYMSLTVLETIYENQEDCTQKLICELTHYPKQSVNLIVKTFLDNGYLELKEIPSDRRNKRIYFTSKGRRYADEIIMPIWQADEAAMGELKEQQREELIQATAVYGQAFCNIITRLIRNGNNAQNS